MTRYETVVGLDIGASQITCVIGGIGPDDLDGIEVLGVGASESKGIRKAGVGSFNAQAASESIREAVENASSIAGVHVDSAVVGITGDHIQSQNVTGVISLKAGGGVVTQADHERVLNQALAQSRVQVTPPRELLLLRPQSFRVDDMDRVEDPVGMNGSNLGARAHVVTMSTQHAQTWEECVEGAGYSVEGMALESYASGLAVLTKDEMSHGCALVDIGESAADIAVFHEGSLSYTGIVNAGGLDIAQELARQFGISTTGAKRLQSGQVCAMESLVADPHETALVKDDSGRPIQIPRQKASGVVRAVLQQIIYHVNSKLAMCQCPLDRGVFLTGGVAQIEGIAALFSEVMNVPVEARSPIQRGQMAYNAVSPAYSAAIGLSLHGAEERRSLRGYRTRNWFGGMFDWMRSRMRQDPYPEDDY